MQCLPTIHPTEPIVDKKLSPASSAISAAACDTLTTKDAVTIQTPSLIIESQDGGGLADRHRKALKLWLASCICFILLCPFVAVMCGMNLHARDLAYNPNPPPVPFLGRTILMDVALIDADPSVQTVMLDWTFVGEENSPCGTTNLTGCTNVNIFFDNSNLLVDGADTIRNSNRPTKPIFVHNATALAINDIIANTATFRTNLAMFSPTDRSSSLIFYPFDEYTSQIFVFAQDTVTNERIGIRIARTRGIADGFKTLAYTRPNVEIPPGMLDIIIDIRPGNLVKTFSVTATIAIWLITLMLLLVMLTCVFFGFRQRSEVLVIPVATLFAFTQLRKSMPGTPSGFGDVLDFVGLLPCLALLSLSAAITLGAFILSDPTERTTALSWDLLFATFPKLSPKRWRKEHASLMTGDLESGSGSKA
ncbi:hypothetical protein BDN70DRAFT_937020 [Pholiota conissans]|uniref:Transmembrane protein n=1 Tax=Pholiota conissans TaxID=109636 RepID=A0A9P5YQE4_9AGAR|nr:hypothetical protein BDN70DRAFT_937020 [Pholiota conissans]